jgi:predicted DsbA family dithiol-disulfide isomerase
LGKSEEGGAALALEVVSDAICPWCWIGKRRLERALGLLGAPFEASIAWRPFELNPAMPRAGIDRRDYRIAKFGSWEHSQSLDARVASAGAEDGLEFRFDRIGRTPNTRDAHRVIRLAGEKGVQGAVVEALFTAYFHEGRDIGALDVLADVGASAGLDRQEVAAMLAGERLAAEVAGDLERARRLGISGVPTVLIRGETLFSGALDPAMMAARLRAALPH